jgi:hypothetical protein
MGMKIRCKNILGISVFWLGVAEIVNQALVVKNISGLQKKLV